MVTFSELSPSLKTMDIGETIDFYTKVLKFSVDSVSPDENPTFCILDHGPVHLMFYVDEESSEPEPGLTGQLHITVGSVMELHASVKDSAEVLWGPEVYHYGRREFSISDNNGYRLVFSEPTSDPPTCPED